MVEVRRISSIGNVPCVFLNRHNLEFVDMKKGDTVTVEYAGNGEVIIRKAFGVHKNYTPPIIKINKKDL